MTKHTYSTEHIKSGVSHTMTGSYTEIVLNPGYNYINKECRITTHRTHIKGHSEVNSITQFLAGPVNIYKSR